MKVFISWSGELSQSIAKELSEWLPSIIQSIEVFYSPDDIKKGENWDSRLTNELQDSKYGIVCLTPENVLAPWIHFEAGALSKTLDSRVSALMINVVTSDIQGPLSRFQATKLEKVDFYQLLVSINEVADSPINEKVLQKSFDAIWDKMYENINNIVKVSEKRGEKVSQQNKDGNTILEEILQLIRKQDAILSNPEKLLPIDYFDYVSRNIAVPKNRLEDIINRISIELRHMYETNEVNRGSIKECYKSLIDLAERCQCESPFVHFLQDNYLAILRLPLRRVRREARDIEDEKMEEG